MIGKSLIIFVIMVPFIHSSLYADHHKISYNQHILWTKQNLAVQMTTDVWAILLSIWQTYLAPQQNQLLCTLPSNNEFPTVKILWKNPVMSGFFCPCPWVIGTSKLNLNVLVISFSWDQEDQSQLWACVWFCPFVSLYYMCIYRPVYKNVLIILLQIKVYAVNLLKWNKSQRKECKF